MEGLYDSPGELMAGRTAPGAAATKAREAIAKMSLNCMLVMKTRRPGLMILYTIEYN